jgi:Spx/MgsR family transcriptional regulator
MKPRLHGIRNCDSVKKARKWLEDHAVDYEFHDFRDAGVDAMQLSDWCAQLGWEALLNRRSTSWRQLDAADRSELNSDKAQRLMRQIPTLIKRPVLVTDNQVSVGFSASLYQSLFAPPDESG